MTIATRSGWRVLRPLSAAAGVPTWSMTSPASPDDHRPDPAARSHRDALPPDAAHPTPARRAAALAVLCTTSGIRMDSQLAADQAGRPGIVLRADHDYRGCEIDHTVLLAAPRSWCPPSVQHHPARAG